MLLAAGVLLLHCDVALSQAELREPLITSIIDPAYAHAARDHYVGTDQHVHELFLSGGKWQSADLTSAAGGVTVSVPSSLVSIIDPNYSNAVREYYVGSDQHVHELFLSSGKWSDGDLFSIAPGPNAEMGSALASVFDPLYNGVRTDYIGTDQHVHELFLSGGKWQSADLTSAAGGVVAIVLYSISGQITSNGSGLSGLTVSLTGTTVAGTSVSQTTTSNSSGNYSFSVPSGGTYTVIPSSATSSPYTFSPESYKFSNLGGNQPAPFTATAVTSPAQTQYTISGQVLGAGYPLPGVTLTLSGSGSAATLSSINGGYSFVVAAGGTYTVTPSLSGYTFSPPSRTYANVNSNQPSVSFTSSIGITPTPSTSSFTILVNGSFNEDPSWENPTDPEYQAIAATFGGTIYAYHWDGTNIYPPFYIDIVSGADGLVNLINSHSFAPGESLNIVAHSHGGNVVKLATYGINHAISNLVNLGTPQNWDLPGIAWADVGNYCQVSSFTDPIQVSGSSPYQVYNFGQDEYQAALWTTQEAIDLYKEDYSDAAYDAEEIADYQADAVYWWLTTKIAEDSPAALNVLFASYSHSGLHTTGVWSQVVNGCYLP